MIDHVWTVLCSRSVIDRETNNMSLFEVIEQLTLGDASPPAERSAEDEGLAPIQLELVTLWTRHRDDESESGRARIRFYRPSGWFDPLTREYNIDLTVHRRVRNRSKLAGLAIREPGRHHFETSVWDEAGDDWHVVATTPLEITFLALK